MASFETPEKRGEIAETRAVFAHQSQHVRARGKRQARVALEFDGERQQHFRKQSRQRVAE
jgi:hypothetical protein